MVNVLDRNHDGHVDMDDLFESHIEGRVEEMEVVNSFKSGKRLPVFIMAQSLVAFTLWLAQRLMVVPTYNVSVERLAASLQPTRSSNKSVWNKNDGIPKRT